MKNVIYYFYNIMVDELNKDNNSYYFYYLNQLYMFSPILNNINIIKDIYEKIKEYSIDSYEIINTNKNEIFCETNNIKYCLLKITGILKYEVKFEEFKYYPLTNSGLDWGNLWSNRLDYYELQIRELGFNYQTTLNTFGLFSGLAENAISYYNLTITKYNTEDSKVGIVHNRMKYPCYLLDYNNPLNMVIDYSIRDIAEYIKSYLLYEEYDLDNVIVLLDKLNTNNKMFNLLYSRLLYPSFYFDVFDKIILENYKDSDIISVISVTKRYLTMLKKIYYVYNIKYQMFKIEWLDKIKI